MITVHAGQELAHELDLVPVLLNDPMWGTVRYEPLRVDTEYEYHRRGEEMV